MVMIIDGVDAKQIVQRSILSGVVSRPVDLQKTLAPEEKRELCDIIQAARQRMARRQKREVEHRSNIIRCSTPGQIDVEGESPRDIVNRSIKAGLVIPRTRRKILTIEQVKEKAEKQKGYQRECMRRLRAKRRECQPAANPPPQVPPTHHTCN